MTIAAAFTLTGCVGYQLGSMLPADIRTVHVPTFVNKTDEPLVEVETTRAFIEQVQFDGSLKIADADVADSVIEVTVLEFDMSPIAYSRSRETLAEEYRITLTSHVIFRRRATGEVLFESPNIQGETTFQVAGDLSSGKRFALPGAADDLARDILETIVELW